MVKKSVLALGLACASFTLMAAQSYVEVERRLSAEQLHATGLDTLSAEQLRQLNRILSENPAPPRTAQDTSSAAGARGISSMIGLNDAPIRSRLKGPVSTWEPGTVFELENGQQWKVLKGSRTLRQPIESPEVIVVPGIAGRWFLQIDEDTPKPRVYLIN